MLGGAASHGTQLLVVGGKHELPPKRVGMVGREGGSTPQIAKLRVRAEGLHQRTLSLARTESQTPEPYTFLRAHKVLSAAQGRSSTS